MINLEKIFAEIIERKHNELGLGQDYNKKFSKIKDFEANAIGQIGEEFVNIVISKITKIKDDSEVKQNDEYDIETNSGLRFEVKTARKGRKNDTFQFNGLNPRYNYHYLICLGLTEENLYYRIFKKDEIKYVHKDKKYYIIQGNYRRQLVQMNPDNHVNFKLTISINDLYNIENFENELRNIIIPSK